MLFRKIAISTILVGISCTAFAQGTPQQRAACSPDVRKFCRHLPRGADTSAFQQCLEANRARLSGPCLRVMNGED
jgi:hypothetical protein